MNFDQLVFDEKEWVFDAPLAEMKIEGVDLSDEMKKELHTRMIKKVGDIKSVM